MLIHPQIDPYIFQLGPIRPTWYGLMYVFGFAFAYWLGAYRTKMHTDWTKDDVSDLMTYLMLSVVLGGRIGYVLFYGLGFWAHDWLYPLKIWQGGMSFHGGLLGVIIACILFARKKKKTLFNVGDYVAPMIPMGLFFGRIGNFINGELWGRATDVPWGMIFPHAGDIPRHPSQLYEAFFEGLILFCIVWFYSAKPRPAGSVAGVFLVFYGIFRIFIEFFREPDPQLSFIISHITMGQILSLPMILFGGFLIWRAYRAGGEGKKI